MNLTIFSLSLLKLRMNDREGSGIDGTLEEEVFEAQLQNVQYYLLLMQYLSAEAVTMDCFRMVRLNVHLLEVHLALSN